MPDDLDDLPFVRTEERERALGVIAALKQMALDEAEKFDDRHVKHRLRNAAQSAGYQRELLAQDFVDEDAANTRKPPT